MNTLKCCTCGNTYNREAIVEIDGYPYCAECAQEEENRLRELEGQEEKVEPRLQLY